MFQLYDDLAQSNMESVISSDPRTGFNMARWLLIPRTSAFKVDSTGMTETEALRTGVIEQYADRQLVLLTRKRRTSLFGSPLSRLVGLMLATGWYSVASVPTPHGWAMEVWNPAQVFPDYDDDGALIRAARVYKMRSDRANTLIGMSGWNPPDRAFTGKEVTVRMLWKITRYGVEHSVVIGTHLAKPPTLAPLDYIPVFTGPVAGLPDSGEITKGENWRGEVGESLIAPIRDIAKNYDKMLTYLQQLLRDTANPRWVEKSKGQPRVNPDELFKRGAKFNLEPDESLEPVSTPPLPAEIRGHQFDLHNQVQRGLFSDISFGNITQQVSGYLMTQVTSSAKQTLDPFFTGVRDVMGEVATRNIEFMRRAGWDLGDKPFPEIGGELALDFDYDVEIPGDFIQRVSAARVANPTFKLSTATLHNVLFPEVQNSLVEQSRIRAEEATENPVFRQLLLLRELNRAANEARENEDPEMAEWLDRAAGLVEQQGLSAADPGGLEAQPVGMRPEALPPEVQEVLAGR